MRKIWLGGMVALVLVAFNSGAGFAEEFSKGFYVEGHGSAAIPVGDDEFETTAYLGGRFGYQISPLFGLEVESGYASFEDEFETLELSIVPLLVNVRAYLVEGKKFDLYVLGGIGVIFTDFKVTGTSAEVNEAFDAATGVDLEAEGITLSIDSLDIDDALAGQAGLGFIYHFSERIAAFAEVRVLLSEADTSARVTVSGPGGTSTESVTIEQELDTVFIGGGVRIKI